ncbi:type I polyketide synthase [Streptomyces sp. Y1]|uniref:Type I polyketide synthase n=1 Tax=Streptomyces sp. Y1 TaxID=3238634 RepID=A0AB39TCN6_9ACTN
MTTAPNERIVEALRSSLTENERLRRQNQQLAEAAAEPVAIVAAACRFPGGADSPEALWHLVAEGGDALSGLPADRGWDLDALTPPGAGPAPQGGFVSGAAEFDPAFFGISPREALAMDPQQRLLLETSWEVFERAGLDPAALRGSRTGVYVGASHTGYGDGVGELPEGVATYAVTGISASVLSGRLAYTFGLEGPAVTVDTACSSSLVALHLAVRALRAGECSLALVGGAAVMAIPGAFLGFSGVGVMAGDSRCKAFAAAADGTGFAEGVGTVLVERLSDARRHGHRVLAVVRGTAVNQDGASSGLTAPNGPAQQRVIRAALADARLAPQDVDAVEAHGTGTALGDPIEAGALLATYGRGRPADRPLRLGSVKSNLGHTQAAAGLAGLIKTVMALRHELLPRTLHVDRPTPHVDWSAGTVTLLTEPLAWPRGERPRRAGVSAFGISGTNAHVIVEEAPVEEAPAEEAPGDGAGQLPLPEPVFRAAAVPVPLSGRGAAGLRAQAARLAAHLRAHPALAPADLGLSLATTRAALERRAVPVAADRAGLLARLDALAADAADTPDAAAGRVAFVFPGQGSQWVGMGAELLDTAPAFAARIADCEAALAPYVDWSLTAVLRGGPGLEQVDTVQAVNWAMAVSLAELWRSFGVEPAAVVGHSQGEIAAACVAGALTLEEGARVVALRSRTVLALAGTGAMASVQLPAAEVAERIAGFGDRLSVAVVNGPAATVVSGEVEAVEQFLAQCQDVPARRTDAGYASHSAHVAPIREALLAALDGLAPHPSAVPFYSTVTGGPLDTTALGADYWYANLSSPVRFADAVERLLADGFGAFVEVSAHPVVAPAIGETIERAGVRAAAVGTLRREEGGPERFLRSLGEAWAQGVAVDWRPAFPAGARTVDLPTYAFQRRRYWLEAARPAPAVAAADPAGSAFWDAVDREDVTALAAALGGDGARLGDQLAPALPALAAWRRGQQRQARIDSWRYRITWKPLGTGRRPALHGTWLLVAPDCDHRADDRAGDHRAGGTRPNGAAEPVDAVRQMLADHGAEVLTVTVPPGRTALADLLPADTPLAGVLSLLAADERPHPEHPLLTAGLAGTVALVQALLAAGTPAPLWCLTSGAVSVARAEHASSPAQAQVWGLGRVVALEQPQLWGGLVDLPAAPDRRALDRLAAVLADPDGEDQLAVRPSGVFARRLVPAPLDGAPAVRPWRPRGTVLVTGGTGALGAHAARWLAANGAEHLVLTSRQGERAPGAAELAAELGALGARVTLAACDLADRDALAALLSAHPPTAVLHAAGVGQASTVDQLDLADTARLFAGKVAGAVHLDELLGDRELDAFVLYSSNAGVWGSGGQAGYAAANAHLDALAEHRRARGLTATAIAWGGWGGGAGMMADGTVRELLQRRGILEMEPDLAVAALVQAVEQDEACVSVTAMDWPRFAPGFTARRPAPLLADLPALRRSAAAAEERAPQVDGGFAERVAALGPREQERAVLDLVRAQVAAVLGHASGEAVEPGRVFRELGFDSLVAVELRNRLNAATGLRLPASLAFDHPTPAALARHVHGELTGRQDTADPELPARTDDDPVAIVGMACRLPGGISTPEELWQALADGVDMVGEAPKDRGWEGLDLARVLTAPEQLTFLQEGGFLTGVGDFDADFFGIGAAEATAMDPQQRLLLELSWESFERGGLDAGALRGSRTGVFLGTFFQGYGFTNRQAPKDTRPYLAGGSSPAIAAGRIAFTLGLEGPAFTVDTGCSSSAVAIHLATRALRAGDCALALAGGVTVLSHPVSFPSLGGGAAPDGRSKPFAAAADGTGWGEGAGMLLLERLSDARRHGHPVLAVLRGTAVNHDGATNGLTAPSGPSQERVIRAALADAGLGAADIDVVEAHGTGSPLGDSVEAEALLATYGRQRPAERPLLVGTVKSHIGHPQAASGAVGVIKTVLALRHRLQPAMLHLDRPSDLVDWSAGTVRLLDTDVPWPVGERPRRAGVSSFGGSGTKVHLIVEEAPTPPEPAGAAAPDGPLPFVLSARTPDALRAQARRLAAHLRAGELPPGDVARTLAAGRAVLDHRAVLLADGPPELLAGLDALVVGERPAGEARLTLHFPDAGPPTDVRELYEAWPAYADAWDAACAHLDGRLELSLREAVFGAVARPLAGDPVDPALAGAAAFAAQLALHGLLASWGVRPDAVSGSGTGLVAAACAAGVLELADAVTLLTDGPAALGRLRPRPGTVPVLLGGAAVGAERFADPAFWSTDLPAAGSPLLTVDPARLATRRALLAALAAVFTEGAAVDWPALFAGSGAALVDLPTYAFQRERHWLADGATPARRERTGAAVDDRTRKETVLEYFRRVNAGDVDQVLELFAADAVIEDPVGQEPRQGAEALREYYEITLHRSRVEVAVGHPVGAQDGSSVAVPVTGRLTTGEDGERRRVSIDCVDVFELDEEGRIAGLRVYWGLTDYAFGEE